MSAKTREFIAPDGGYGWVIAFAVGTSNIFLGPVMQGFTMIYGSKFEELGISATEVSIIININLAFGLVLGIGTVPLFRIYGYRKIALIGQIFYSAGLILTSFASSFIGFVITYGFMTSLGVALNGSALIIALNSYFKKKLGRAVGFSTVVTGIGPIFVPQIISFLLTRYSTEGTMLILGAMTLNHVVGGLLLRPVKWYAKRADADQDIFEDGTGYASHKYTSNYFIEEIIVNKTESDTSNRNNNVIGASGNNDNDNNNNNNNDNDNDNNNNNNNNEIVKISNGKLGDDNKALGYSEYDVSRLMKDSRTLNVQDWLRNSNIIINNNNKNNSNYYYSYYNYCNGINNVNNNLSATISKGLMRTDGLRSAFKRSKSLNRIRARRVSFMSLKSEASALRSRNRGDIWPTKQLVTANEADDQLRESSGPGSHAAEEPGPWPSHERSSGASPLIEQIVRAFDLELLSDGLYMTIMLSMSLAMFVELNFTAMMPLLLKEMHIEMDSVATMLSTLAIADLVFRALSPYVGELLRQPPAFMFLFSIAAIMITRMALMYIDSYTSILIVSIFLGMTKGFRIVYMYTLIPSCVPLEKIAGATNIQSLVNGLILFFGSPLIGLIKDQTGSYRSCVGFLNLVSLLVCIFMFAFLTIRYVYNKRKLHRFYELN